MIIKKAFNCYSTRLYLVPEHESFTMVEDDIKTSKWMNWKYVEPIQ